MTKVRGIHHVSTIASDPQRNIDFFAGLLGLRLVKRTVNFDDPETYHLYYGDAVGTPGLHHDLLPVAGREAGPAGAGRVRGDVVLRAAERDRILARAIRAARRDARDARRRAAAATTRSACWPSATTMARCTSSSGIRRPSRGRRGRSAPGIPAEHAIHGFHSVTLWVEEGEPTERVLVDTLGFRADDASARSTKRYVAGDGGPSAHRGRAVGRRLHARREGRGDRAPRRVRGGGRSGRARGARAGDRAPGCTRRR